VWREKADCHRPQTRRGNQQAIAQCRGKSHFAGSTLSAWPGVAVSGGVAGALSLPAGKCSIGAPTEPGRVSGDVGGSIGAGRLRSWHVLTRNISIATELTTDAIVKNGVQKALQRARRRSSLSSSRVFFGEALSTITSKEVKPSFGFFAIPSLDCLWLIYYDRTLKSNSQVPRPKYCLSTKMNSITRNHHAQ
jgi:hypothetical protein